MPTEHPPDTEIMFVLAEDMLTAGVEQLKHTDFVNGDPYEAVARIYCAMEIVRVAIMDAMGSDMPPMDKSKLN